MQWPWPGAIRATQTFPVCIEMRTQLGPKVGARELTVFGERDCHIAMANADGMGRRVQAGGTGAGSQPCEPFVSVSPLLVRNSIFGGIGFSRGKGCRSSCSEVSTPQGSRSATSTAAACPGQYGTIRLQILCWDYYTTDDQHLRVFTLVFSSISPTYLW